MLIENKKQLKRLINDLFVLIQNKKDELFETNKKATLDTDYWIADDYKAIRTYLKDYVKNNYSAGLPNKIKPKGKILIILSYNEPFVMSIIPILNALVVGNEVIIKPSRKTLGFVKTIWQKSGFIEKYKLKLEIIFTEKPNEIKNLVQNVQAVYFFGSYKVAQIISRICGQYYVEFYPEVETADAKIFNNSNQSIIKNDVILTLKESFSHSGQICQRIQGIFVQKKFYNQYIRLLKEEFYKLVHSNILNNFIDGKYVIARKAMIKRLYFDIKKSKASEIIKFQNIPLLVINPKKNSDFIKNAYFLPVLWISSFNSKTDLIQILNSRKFFLGLNIQSNNSGFINYIINHTRFTRYTVNTSHTNVKAQEGWGGSWPSGYSGYKNWIEHFSNKYIVIR